MVTENRISYHNTDKRRSKTILCFQILKGMTSRP